MSYRFPKIFLFFLLFLAFFWGHRHLSHTKERTFHVIERQVIEGATPSLVEVHPIMAIEALDWKAWFTVVLFICTFIALVQEVRPPDVIMLISAGLLVIFGIITPQQFLSGFSHEVLVIIAMLCVIARTLEINGILNLIATRILTRSQNYAWQIFSFMAPVAALSGFLNNTAVALLMMPAVRNWAWEKKLAPSKFLIPLSYATLFGGMCTLIGTSTNLIVDEMLHDQNPLVALGFFELAKIGIPCALTGILYMTLAGRHLLPERQDPTTAVTEQTREFTGEFFVEEDSPVAHKHVEEASRKHFNGELLVEIQRHNSIIDSPRPDETILPGDRLIFAGDIHQIAQLHAVKGLRSCADPRFKLDLASSHFSEVVISLDSSLIGKTLRRINFRSTYGASVLAIYRHGKRVLGNVGGIVLQPGDNLMLLSSEPWLEGSFYTRDFYYIRHSEKLRVFNPWKTAFVLTVACGMLLSIILGGVSITLATMGAALLLLFSRSIPLREAQSSVVWNVLLLIAASLAFGNAVQTTGVANYFAEIILFFVGTDPQMLIAGIFLVTMVATELLSNNVSALLLFPIAIQTTRLTGFESMEAIKAVGVTVAIASSCGFAVPTGYQTHMIVYGPGGYRFRDYLKVGIFLDVIMFCLATFLIPKIWPLVE